MSDQPTQIIPGGFTSFVKSPGRIALLLLTLHLRERAGSSALRVLGGLGVREDLAGRGCGLFTRALILGHLASFPVSAGVGEAGIALAEANTSAPSFTFIIDGLQDGDDDYQRSEGTGWPPAMP